MTQCRLFHETAEEALSSLIDVLGGYKRVAGEMWPSMPLEEARRRLADCLNPTRAHKLELSEIVWLLKKGRAAGQHVAMAFINDACGYDKPNPVDPETEVARLQREFTESVNRLSDIQRQLVSRQADAAQIRRVA